jgi:hypothetical protein
MLPGAAQPTPDQHDQPTQTASLAPPHVFNAPHRRTAALGFSMYRSFSKKENGFPHSQPSNRFFLRKILNTGLPSKQPQLTINFIAVLAR